MLLNSLHDTKDIHDFCWAFMIVWVTGTPHAIIMFFFYGHRTVGRSTACLAVYAHPVTPHSIGRFKAETVGFGSTCADEFLEVLDLYFCSKPL